MMIVLGIVLLVLAASSAEFVPGRDRPASAQVGLIVASSVVALGFLAASMRCFGVI